METGTHSANAAFAINTDVLGHERIDYDKRVMRKVLVKEGAAVRKEARRLIARRAVSKPGENPGRDTGATQRSIKVKVSSGGFWVRIAPFRTEEMGKDFYPAYLYYGTKRGVAKRGNYMVQALEKRRQPARAAIRAGLASAIKPR